mmetsp:Transcript_29981/g.30429  ORF Transcript_29981/g.30429 Transcript_29981/m.30429 type:complete len:96 (-) Transcript_29981:27-314(-)
MLSGVANAISLSSSTGISGLQVPSHMLTGTTSTLRERERERENTDLNAEIIKQKALNIKAQRLAEAIRDASFISLDEEVQKRIRQSYVDTVLGEE